MKGFFKGFFVCAFVLLLSNFIWGYMGNWTYEVAKAHFSGEEKVDSLSDEDVNLSIAKVLQEKYGADSLMVSSIGSPLTKYEYYVSGVKGTKELSDKTQRMKKVSFSKGSLQYRVNVFYNCTDGSVAKIENDNTPTQVVEVQPIKPTAQPSVQSPTVAPIAPAQKDTTTANNQNIGTPTNVGDYNNNSDV